MSNINNGGPAFPVEGGNLRDLFGMTLRDYFAAKAMEALLHNWKEEVIPQMAYKMADAMLAEREK